MNALLVYPKYPDTFWSFKHVLKFVSKKAAFPPLGLMTVASMLPKEWNKKLIDVNITKLTDQQIEWADTVLIGAMVVQKESAKEIIQRCKEKGKTVIAGGPAFTTQHKNFPGVDHFVLNEAEITLPLFLEDLKKGGPKKIYTSDKRPDIKETPVPLWSLIDFKDYASMSVQYSRGCPFNCEFCDIVIMNGRIPRTKTPEQIIKEIQSLYDAGWRGQLFIVDDNFIGKKEEVKKMLAHLIEWQKEHDYPFQLYTEASTNLADDNELMQLMSTANFFKVFLGIETPCVDSLKECGKMQNATRDLAEAVKTIHNNGMQVMGGFIVGFDNDNEGIFDAQINFIQQTGVVTAMVGLLNALPQTRLWHRLKAEGRLLQDTSGENTDGSLNFAPKMGRQKLTRGYKRILSTIYSPKQYYQRIDTFIRHYKPTARTRVTKKDIKAFFRSVWSIGVLSNSRLRFWKLILKTGFTKRKSFPVAVELAILGLHFEKITKKVNQQG
ncbi:DUF4070 domain-containing protein [Candidatus Woesearchaeota archaeon]|nr:DUF4070 domain-containing protein [Candidatus Woesearchaeota archaeon]